MSDLHMLARVRDTTGHRPPRLKPFESVEDLLITDDRIVLKLAVVKTVETKFTTRIVSRGTILHVWTLIGTDWVPQEPFAVWWSTDELMRTF